MWKKRGLLQIFNNHLVDYPSPVNVNYMWSIGSLAGICLGIQIISGVFLAMHYVPHVDYAFLSVEHIMRDVNNGWLFRYIHANGASMMFIALYIHMAKHLYYGSYMRPRQGLWVTGVIIFVLTVITAFMGYVLPWGQMSFWGATVITNLFTAVPVIGKFIVSLLWGGFAVDNPTLNRFLSLHFLLPFVLAGLSILHLILLHTDGNNNPLGIHSKFHYTFFYPYFYTKDLFALFAYLTLYMTFVFFFPNALGDADNYIMANSLVTPTHIVPEWYLLPFYAILRSIPDKLGGVLTMGGAFVALITLPFLTPRLTIKSSVFRPITRVLFWFNAANVMLLCWIGQQVVEYPFIEIGQISTVFYFLYFLILLPLCSFLEYKWCTEAIRKS
jgi:quinol-cytochrome oxidoreductase complex cytochrome b subunit